MFPRSSGVLLHVTSLPGGRLGPEAFRFVDFLAAAGQRWWQVLPVVPPDGFGSPYAGLSAFAGHEGLLAPGHEGAGGRRAPWLDDYALFRALRDAHGKKPWTKWPRGLRDRTRLDRARRDHADGIARYVARQHAFDAQWRELKTYANERGIGLIGDLPLFVAHDSADVWAHRDLFKLNKSGTPTVVAGVPPDYFSRNGQRWGNPHYDWKAMRRRRYRWWIARLRRAFELFDAVRLDHFLGFVRAWEVPARARTAKRGRYVAGPGGPFFTAVTRALGKRPIIAEDLGLVTPEATRLRERQGFPGMRVLHFSFGANHDLPHTMDANTVVYTGTHDNNTTKGWFAEGGWDRERARRYAGCRRDAIGWGLIRVALASPAALAITPAQDLLSLGAKARMNVPGRARGNWRWRLERGALTKRLARRLRDLTEATGR